MISLKFCLSLVETTRIYYSSEYVIINTRKKYIVLETFSCFAFQKNIYDEYLNTNYISDDRKQFLKMILPVMLRFD